MTDSASMLQQLDESMSRGSRESRLRALWHTTDVLISGRYSEADIRTLGEVIERLAQGIELTTRSELARRLAHAKNAPINCVRQLAQDPSIQVAGPILRHSARLDVTTLLAIARSGSQPHLVAISRRPSIAERVTDVLVVAGNRNVVSALACNAGARFSNFGFRRLVERSEHDPFLVETIASRADIPRHIFQQLIAKASAELRSKLAHQHPAVVAEIEEAVSDGAGDLHSIFGPASKRHFAARKQIAVLHGRGALGEKEILGYARSRQMPEVAIGLSLLCKLPANVIERGLIDPSGEMPMILAKTQDFSWETATALLFLGVSDRRMSASVLDALKTKYARLTADAARSTIRLYRSREEHAAVAVTSSDRRSGAA